MVILTKFYCFTPLSGWIIYRKQKLIEIEWCSHIIRETKMKMFLWHFGHNPLKGALFSRIAFFRVCFPFYMHTIRCYPHIFTCLFYLPTQMYYLTYYNHALKWFSSIQKRLSGYFALVYRTFKTWTEILNSICTFQERNSAQRLICVRICIWTLATNPYTNFFQNVLSVFKYIYRNSTK